MRLCQVVQRVQAMVLLQEAGQEVGHEEARDPQRTGSIFGQRTSSLFGLTLPPSMLGRGSLSMVANRMSSASAQSLVSVVPEPPRRVSPKGPSASAERFDNDARPVLRRSVSAPSDNAHSAPTPTVATQDRWNPVITTAPKAHSNPAMSPPPKSYLPPPTKGRSQRLAARAGGSMTPSTHVSVSAPDVSVSYPDASCR